MRRDLRNVAIRPSRPEDEVWELFHESSKVGRYDGSPSPEDVLERMKNLEEALPLDAFPAIALPAEPIRLEVPLSEAILGRASARGMKPTPLSLPTVGTLLHHAYGVTRDETGSGFPRAFRAAPSGGALYPLELFFHSRHIDGAPPGLYHYNPVRNEIRRVKDEDQTPRIAELLVPFQSHLAQEAALIVFITALFGRSTFKYSTRGYRFVLLEAGHVAQNLGLTAGGLGLAYLNIGGYFDRHVDEFLGLDGLTHSTIYMAAIGAHPSEPV